MIDNMNELTQFSACAGKLVLENVPGETSQKVEHENDIHAADGSDRTMYAYAPISGCPDPKQTQILMVLRDQDSEVSARELMKKLGLDKLAEEKHFLLLFPNPQEGGWNFAENPAKENDMDFLGRCFGVLRGSKLGVNGFNGMIFYLAASQGASALLMTMAAKRPLTVPAMMIGSFPEGYQLPADSLGVETAAWVSDNPYAVEYLKKANGISGEETADGVTTYFGTNPNCRLLVTDRILDEGAVLVAWERLFSESRRWQNDTYGTYQHRTNFTQRGFVPHVKDTSLGLPDGLPRTWYEYIPPQLRGTNEKVPLVFYFHGVNCVPLYGAEQSNWHDIADRENLIVVYPAPTRNKAWNIHNSSGEPGDFDYILALIEHMKTVHPIDETRIYATGFSMGGMMTHAIASCYPEVFAAVAPFNAFDFGYFKTPQAVADRTGSGNDSRFQEVQATQRRMADAKRAEWDYRMPLFQSAGLDDGLIASWPITEETDDERFKTINRWMDINNISSNGMALNKETLTGIAADESFYEDGEERFFHQRWHSKDAGAPSLLELVLVKRMPHAIVPVEVEYAWNFLKRFSRRKDGTLILST